MKIYLAARYDRREEIARYAEQARARGIGVTSSWLLPPVVEDPNSTRPRKWWAEEARRDLQEIEESNMLVMFTEEPGFLQPRGGRHVEFGYALGLRKSVAIIGAPENIFQALFPVVHFASFDQFLFAYQPARWARER